uniref:Uncharacterized protein n=1 Tax=Arundo donax TaxID=35708 RepID=A0A0A8YSA5_ARUDO
MPSMGERYTTRLHGQCCDSRHCEVRRRGCPGEEAGLGGMATESRRGVVRRGQAEE